MNELDTVEYWKDRALRAEATLKKMMATAQARRDHALEAEDALRLVMADIQDIVSAGLRREA